MFEHIMHGLVVHKYFSPDFAIEWTLKSCSALYLSYWYLLGKPNWALAQESQTHSWTHHETPSHCSQLSDKRVQLCYTADLHHGSMGAIDHPENCKETVIPAWSDLVLVGFLSNNRDQMSSSCCFQSGESLLLRFCLGKNPSCYSIPWNPKHLLAWFEITQTRCWVCRNCKAGGVPLLAP